MVIFRLLAVHIVGLDFDPAHPRMRAYTQWTEKNITDLSIRRLEHCLQTGAIRDITWQEVEERFPDVGWFCNEQVFRLLQEKQGIDDRDYWTFFRAFNGAPVKGVSNSLPAEEAIDVIRASGGIAVLAHPHNQTQYLAALHACGLMGVEVDHPDLTPELGLYQSGGTDHTGWLGNSMKRGAGIPGHEPLVPYDADVSNGATQDGWEQILHRSLG